VNIYANGNGRSQTLGADEMLPSVVGGAFLTENRNPARRVAGSSRNPTINPIVEAGRDRRASRPWQQDKTANQDRRQAVRSIWQEQREADRQRMLASIRRIMAKPVIPLARDLSSVAVRIVLDAIPSARSSFNPLTGQLLDPLLQKGERYSRSKEAEFFGSQPTVVTVANTRIAREAALTEVLAAEASHTESESEAAAFIGTLLPISLRIMEGYQLLRPVLPVLLAATARLVSFLHRHSLDSRRLLRLVPTILRQTVASLIAARSWGCPLTSALVGCVLAAHTRRVLANAKLVDRSITRNALIRISTVAAAPSFTGRRRSIQNQRAF
jgi:hypothetical protein